tara:strand:+ start:544 stop:1044 length:501 start_codon:yes stop_codon:yes gene_type:complete
MMKIIDNFLSEEEFKNLRDYISSTSFPWYFGLVTNDSKIAQFVHSFYANDIPNPTYSNVEFLRGKLNMAALIRIKVNLNPRTETLQVHRDAFHIDYPDITTAVFYLNTCDGYTLFEDGPKVNSVENRIVIFDSNMRHTGTSCTDQSGRLVMNINYFPCKKDQYFMA